MKRFILIYLSFIYSVFGQKPETKIAFVSDIHFLDIYGHFSDTDFDGIFNPKNKKNTILRTMNAQLHSTRIFNENYFALIAALDDIAARGIKIVAFPGDYTDDGQPINLKGLQRILKNYQDKYHIQFLITTGNHDPVSPFAKEGGKTDFMADDGRDLGIFSSEKLILDSKNYIISKDISHAGYQEIASELRDFGFYPKKEYLYYSTPFDSILPENYSFKQAEINSQYQKRFYEIEPNVEVPDFSYVVEPTKGVWLLAIDGNTYLPKNTTEFYGPEIGYNLVLKHRKYLINWVRKMADLAKKEHKILIAFTHYPLVDFNDNASNEIKNLLGKDKWQMERLPELDVAETFAKAGIYLHFAGHMHINDTGIYEDEKNFLVNVQVPSLAAYLPAYKILTIHSSNDFEVETIPLTNVANFDELFPLYEKEYKWRKQHQPENLWNKKILKTKNYHDYLMFHLKELVRLRFIPNDWPKEFIEKYQNYSGLDLMNLTDQCGENLSKSELKALKKWTFLDLIFDLYKLQSADELAFQDIGSKRLNEYQIIGNCFRNSSESKFSQFKLLFQILEKLSHGDASNHFYIDLKSRKVKSLP